MEYNPMSMYRDMTYAACALAIVAGAGGCRGGLEAEVNTPSGRARVEVNAGYHDHHPFLEFLDIMLDIVRLRSHSSGTKGE